MSTPPILVPISATDDTGPAFASATVKAQAFQASLSSTAGSFKEARGAAMLLGEEVGIHMNRHLVTAMASSKLLQGILTDAFPIVAAIGFAEILGRIPDAIKKAADFFGGFTEASKSAMEEATKNNEKIYKSFQDFATGYRLLATFQAEIAKNAASAPKSDMEGVGETSRKWGAVSGPLGDLAGYFYQIYETRTKINDASDQDLKLSKNQLAIVEQLGKLYDDRNKENEKNEEEAVQRAVEARNAWVQSIDAAEKSSSSVLAKGQSPSDKELTTVEEQLTIWEKIRQAHAGINAIANQYIERLQTQVQLTKAEADSAIAMSLAQSKRKSFSDTVTVGGSDPLYSGTSQAMELYKIQTDQNVAYQEAGKLYDENRTKIQKFNDEMDKLVAVSNATNMSQKTFREEAAKIGEPLDAASKAYRELGNEIGKTITQSLLFGRSWSDAFKAILADIMKCILQMYVFGKLSDAMGGKNGGFFGQLFAGMAGLSGRAGGGSVSGGMSYLVGEKGPELFTPGSSGAITPNGALGGGGDVYHIDARGADASVEQRIMRILPILKRQAVTEAVATVQSRGDRR